MVFGHSMGAITAMLLAAEHPELVKGLVLEDPPLDVPPIDPVVRRASMASEIEPWRSMAADERYQRAAARHGAWDREEVEPWVDSKVVVDLAILDQLYLFDQVDWRGALSRSRTPGLLLTGETALGALISDGVLAEVSRTWTAGSATRIPDSGHCVHRDRWDASMRPIREFLLDGSATA